MPLLVIALFSVALLSCQTTQQPVLSGRLPAGFTIQDYPILHALEKKGVVLSDSSKVWLKKWKGMDLEDDSLFLFQELSGSTSVNLKIQKKDSSEPEELKSRGTFVPRNSAGNPNTEIAYFNLSAILGSDSLFRPAARYELGPKASSTFKILMEKAVIKNVNRIENRKRILAAIATGNPLMGCVKAKKPDSARELDELADTRAANNGAPQMNHPIMKALQASNPQPRRGEMVQLMRDYSGDIFVLAKEYSLIMTFDSIFQQWDRYSGGNIGIQKDANGVVHFYSTDNGGADLSKTTTWAERNLGWFSRYDRELIKSLRDLNAFLENPNTSYLGYTSAESFVVDLGLYFELPPAVYVERLKRNLKLLFDRVDKAEAQYGRNAYFD